ncbi:hypothetical protein [Blastococcus sp. VKM Ac-2987]|uniref:hypothetical protein n=1 Tax=Blastococcus sp. VKM Ac-2987 TaxID=3004141 RepID=UPI0022AB6C76|nr:hypothetical protein [Blastococcus sp. VKM Ac-2987]MCZ2857819.1 hypothetical protein [Blastococcus sp. VKM Ac-2987]
MTTQRSCDSRRRRHERDSSLSTSLANANPRDAPARPTHVAECRELTGKLFGQCVAGRHEVPVEEQLTVRLDATYDPAWQAVRSGLTFSGPNDTYEVVLADGIASQPYTGVYWVYSVEVVNGVGTIFPLPRGTGYSGGFGGPSDTWTVFVDGQTFQVTYEDYYQASPVRTLPNGLYPVGEMCSGEIPLYGDIQEWHDVQFLDSSEGLPYRATFGGGMGHLFDNNGLLNP